MTSELYFLCICILTGMMITAAYDVLRILRRVIVHNGFFVGVEDFLFWIFAAAYIFLVLHKTNDGMIRWFSVVGLALGMYLYKRSIGEHFVLFMSTSINQLLHFVYRCALFLAKPLKALISFGARHCQGVRKVIKNMKNKGNICKKRLTSNLKRVRIKLCKHRGQKQALSRAGSKEQ